MWHHAVPSNRMAFRRGEGLPGRVWETGNVVWSGNIQEEVWFVRRDPEIDLGMHGAFGFPVSVDGDIVAVLEFFTPEDVVPDPHLLMLVEGIGSQLGRIIERREWEQERAHLAAIVDWSYDAIIGKALDGTITSWNTGAEQVYGFSAEEAVGRSISLILPAGLTGEEEEIRQAVRTGRRLTQFETHRCRKDGADVFVALTVSPIRDAQGRIVGSSTIERDITQRVRRERELEAAKAAAEEARHAAETANKTKSEFLANISHELRTPMNAIMGMLELALGEDLGPMMRDYLNTARDSSQTLLYLLDDLLDFSRMEAGRFELESEPCDLRDVVEGMVRTLSLRACEKGLELATSVDADVPHRLQGDCKRLRQVLMNLAGNAIKFTEQGEVIVTAAVANRSKEEIELLFSVKDTGIGISPEDQERVFAPFTQVDASASRRQSGSGLGLAICSELVEKMGGRIWVESVLGKGSTFFFTARLQVLPDQEFVPPHTSEIRDVPVLVVDDNATNLAILQEILASWDMKPTVVNNGRVGLKLLRDATAQGKPFPLAIIDALMPDMDGFTLVETIRNEELTETAAVLMLSAADRQTFRDHCEDLKDATFLDKPVSQSNLLEAVLQALHGSRRRDAVHRVPSRAARSLRVLLAEDTPANQKVVLAILERRGHHAVIADNGREALEQLKQQNFDVVLMDVQMPTMDGLQATAAIRELSDTKKSRIPIIAMTAHARREDRRRCQQAGMDAYISKPIDVRRLITLVERTTHQQAQADPALWTSDPNLDALAHEVVSESVSDTEESNTDGVINRPAALARMGGNEQLFAHMARFFLEDSPRLIAQLREGLRRENAELVTRTAHSLKGLAANFDAHAACRSASLIEELGRAEALEKLSQELPPLLHQIQRLQAELQQYAS